MGLFDKFSELFKGEKSGVDIELRFERLRSSVSGTMSSFFVARDRDHQNKTVGVKICDSEKVEFFESRFKGLKKPAEGEIAMSMNHPNVVKTFEYGKTNKGMPYLVMEFIDGPGLQAIVQERKKEKVRGHSLKMIRDMAAALAYVHRCQYIHRDICPRNFICSEDMSIVKLIDFGLSVPATKPFMQPGNRTGTPLYMAPEVVRRRATDQRVDIFSFGVTCYHLLTFELPWPVGDASGMAALHHDTSPPTDIFIHRPDLDKKLGAAVMGAMHPNLNTRTPDMETFIQQIKNIKGEMA
ncbi:MAG: serine/threonine-protein kinase [Pirellulaceae bacterium]|nr:serine/threonine-protein kinase [Pirellulaceae bacterium]